MSDNTEITMREADKRMAARFISESDGDFPELSALFARHAAQARLEGATEMRHAALRACADQSWAEPPQNSASACSQRIRMVDPAEIAALSTRGDQK